jgi:hypothetical protein
MRKQTKLILGGVATLTLAVGVAFLAGWILSAMRSDEKRGIATGDVLGMQFAMRGFLTKERLHLLAPNGADKILDHRETKRLLEAMTGAVNELNPSGLVYWWPTESQRKAGKIEDPWGKDYRIALDGDRDGRMQQTGWAG